MVWDIQNLHLYLIISVAQHIRSEVSRLLGVLKDGRHFYRSSPVHVVKTLAETDLLQNPLFHLRLRINYLVMVWYRRSFSRLLAYQIKVVVVGY